MKKFFIYPVVLFALLSACTNNSKPEDPAGSNGQEHEHESSNTVSLSRQQLNSIQVQLGAVEQKQLTASLKANGILKVPNQNKASVTSLYGGVIRSILVQPGNTVKKGQAIATITNPQFITLQEEYLSLQTRIRYAELEYKRQKELSSNNAGALKLFQQSETELRTLKTRTSSLRKQLELIGINLAELTDETITSVVSITSPVGGAVSNIMVNIGSNVTMNTPIAEVVDNSQLHLDLYVYEKDLPKVKVGQLIHFTLTNNPGKEYDAEIFGISNTFEDATKALSVHAMVKGDKSGLIDGMNITALVSLEHATVPAVPTDAIINYLGNDYIFIVSDARSEGEHKQHTETHNSANHDHQHEPAGKGLAGHQELVFERIPVRKGTTDVGYSEITLLKDIPANAKVVTQGAFFILAKMTDSGGHAH